MALRQTTGVVESLLRLIGLNWSAPDFSTLSRRQKTLKVNIPDRGSQGPLQLLIDTTGIKLEGEGEWTEEGQQTVRGTVCPTTAQARRFQATGLAQDPHWDRRE
jgi:IS5 family transposase